MKKQSKIRKMLVSKIWFLVVSIIFAIGVVRFLLSGDTIGAIIYLVTALLFLIGFVGRIKFNGK